MNRKSAFSVDTPKLSSSAATAEDRPPTVSSWISEEKPLVLEYLTAILVFVTTIYAYLTHRMAKSSEASVQAVRDQSEALLRPYIEVTPYVRPNTTVLYLRIENTGKTGAQNVRLSIDRDFYQFGKKEDADYNLRTKAAFNQSIDSLGPRHKLTFALAQGFVIFGDGGGPEVTPQQFIVTASYEFAGKKVEEVHRIDLRPYIGTEGERDPLVEELEKLRQAVERQN